MKNVDILDSASKQNKKACLFFQGCYLQLLVNRLLQRNGYHPLQANDDESAERDNLFDAEINVKNYI